MKRTLTIVGGVAALLVVLAAGVYVTLYLTALRPTRPVGVTQVLVPDPGHPPLTTVIWYPTIGTPRVLFAGLRGQWVAVGAPPAGDHLPLVVMSHGTSGGSLSHADTALALASAGFVVAAPAHTGDNLEDSREVGASAWFVDRSRHVARTIDFMLGAWKDRARIDPARIGVFGFSAGATTALIDAGGVPDLGALGPHCARVRELICRLVKPGQPAPASSDWTHDRRIKAVVAAAPGIAFAFAPNGLRSVSVPVQLWVGKQDRDAPGATNAAVVRALLPTAPDYHLVAGADHLAFLMPCGPAGVLIPQVCHDAGGFDRAAFHARFNDAVVRFFLTRLPPSRDARPDPQTALG